MFIYSNKFIVYVLKGTKNKNNYVGQTNNLKERMIRHLNKESKSTKSMGELKLVYFEVYNTRSEAMKREKFFKSCKGYRVRNMLIQNFKCPLINNYNNLAEQIESLQGFCKL